MSDKKGPVIAEHHLPGHWRSTGKNAHELVCDWPDGCYVQWGASGIVFGKDGARQTAFFEAFPVEPKTFIRGEGETIAAAEEAAFAKLQRILTCPGHEFERGGRSDGFGYCKHCHMGQANAFEPLTRCHVCDKPTAYSLGHKDGQEFWYCEEHKGSRVPNGHLNFMDKIRAMDEEDDEAPV